MNIVTNFSGVSAVAMSARVSHADFYGRVDFYEIKKYPRSHLLRVTGSVVPQGIGALRLDMFRAGFI